MGLELKRITEDVHCMNSISEPLASLDENTCDDLRAGLHNFNTAENRSLLYSNKRHAADDGLVKATIMWKPVGDHVKEEPNEFRYFGTEGVTQQSHKSFTTANLYKKVTYGEKENLVSAGSGRAKGGSLDFSNSNINTGLSGFIDGKRLQDRFACLSKPVTRLEIKVVDELNEEVGGPICDGKPVNECKAIARKVSAGPLTGILEKTESFYSQKRQSDFRREDSLCFAPNSSIQSSIIESREEAQAIASVQEKMKGTSHDLCAESTQSMKAPLLSQFQHRSDIKSFNFTHRPEIANPCSLSQLKSPTQNFEENVCDVWRQYPLTAKTPLYGQFRAQNMGEHSCSMMRPESLKIPVLAQSKSQSIQDAQSFEEISAQNNDHFVVLFSVQNALRGSTGRIIRQELLKLSSLCSQYSRKILSWILSLATEENIRGCLRRLRQIFSSKPRGFVNLNSQKMPEFSTNTSSSSSNRKLAKDKELKAVLMKINEVLTSMERTYPDSVQESKTNFRSPEGVKAAASCAQHGRKAFATVGA